MSSCLCNREANLVNSATIDTTAGFGTGILIERTKLHYMLAKCSERMYMLGSFVLDTRIALGSI